MKKHLLASLFFLFLSGCYKHYQYESYPPLVSINIVDRNGFNETITSPERLSQYAGVDFCTPQPYQRVLRVYERDFNGNISSSLTTYHTNGQPKQYLEVVNSRAMGAYREWYQNGRLKLEACLVGGEASLNPGAEKSWLFDNECRAWDEDGRLEAIVPYSKGELEGESLYFHPNGEIWKRVPFQHHQIEGEFETYYSDGVLLQTSCYKKGVQNGETVRYWPNGMIAAQEEYIEGALLSGVYCDQSGAKISTIENGKGWRAVFNRERVSELHQYQSGRLEGQVQQLDEGGRSLKSYQIKNGLKNGEEIDYYLDPLKKQPPHPQLLITWNEGKVHGTAKTWYDHGGLESQREISNNKKNGLAMAWYRNGSLMLLEEYENDEIIKGDYYCKDEKRPVSTICNGKGEATLFDAEGNFTRKIPYKNGKPILE